MKPRDPVAGHRYHPAMIDIDAVRADTPATAQVIHFNNAGAALQPDVVVDAVIQHLRLEQRLGGYEAGDAAAEAKADTYGALAEMLGCAADEIALTTSASEAWWRAFQSIPLQPGDRVLTSRAEYNANAFALIQARDAGIDVQLVPDDPTGQVDLDALEAMLDDRVKLVTLTHIPTSGGLVNPAAQVGALAKAHGAWFLLDACQSAGQRPLDVDTLQCDFLALTGRKFLRGPGAPVRSMSGAPASTSSVTPRSSTATRPTGWPTRPTRCTPGPSATSCSSLRWPPGWAWAWPFVMRWIWASTPSPNAPRRWARPCGPG